MRIMCSLRVADAALVLLSILLVGCGLKNNDTIRAVSSDSVSVIFAGDVLLDRGVRRQIERRGVNYVFSSVRDSFCKADAVVVNLECPFSDVVSPVFKKFVFRADAEWASVLPWAGITHAALANNHSYDQGGYGLTFTDNVLRKSNVIPIGYGDSLVRVAPAVITSGKHRVAVFNSVFLRLECWNKDNDQQDICRLNAAGLADVIRDYKRSNPRDFVIAFVHWGVEFMPHSSLTQQAEAMCLVAGGADAVIGSHPHVVQNADSVYGVPVIYSLGNFVFDQRRAEGRKAQMAKVVVGDSVTVYLHDVEIQRCHPVPVGRWKKFMTRKY